MIDRLLTARWAFSINVTLAVVLAVAMEATYASVDIFVAFGWTAVGSRLQPPICRSRTPLAGGDTARAC
jgi:hypothetical protein